MKINIEDQVTTSDDVYKIPINDEKNNNTDINFLSRNDSNRDVNVLKSEEEKKFLIEENSGERIENDNLSIDDTHNIDDLLKGEATYKLDSGKIVVFDKMDHINGVQVEGAQINLYKLSGLNPSLVESKTTDSLGKVVFSDLEEGSYRVIAIVDKRFFQRPEYHRWNEISLDSTNKEDTVIVVNKIKPEYRRKLYK